jgi:hypothetical protein
VAVCTLVSVAFLQAWKIEKDPHLLGSKSRFYSLVLKRVWFQLFF